MTSDPSFESAAPPAGAGKAFFPDLATGLGAFAFAAGWVLLYLGAFGRTVSYTQTWYHLAPTPPELYDYVSASIPIMGFFPVIVLLFARNRLYDLDAWSTRPGLRHLLLVLRLGASLLLLFAIFQGFSAWVREDSSVLQPLERVFRFSLAVPLALLSWGALVWAVRPAAPGPPGKWDREKRIAAFVLAAVALAAMVVMAELGRSRIDRILEVDRDSRKVPVEPTHNISASFLAEDRPAKFAAGQSFGLEVFFHISEFDPAAQVRLQRFQLEKGRCYTARAVLRVKHFEVVSAPEENEREACSCPLDWRWTVISRPPREGAPQSATIDLFLVDPVSHQDVFGSPISTIEVSAGKPWGLPSWLLLPWVGAGAIVAGLAGMVLPGFRDR